MSSPRSRPRSIRRSASRREQPNLRLERPVGLGFLDQHAQDDPRARRMLGEFHQLRLGIRGELLDAHGMRVRNVGGPLDRVAEGDVAGGDAECQAEVDLAARGRVEMRALRGQGRDHLGGGVRLDRVVDHRLAEALRQRVVLRAQHVEVEDDRRTVEFARADVGILARRNLRVERMSVKAGGITRQGGSVAHAHLHQSREATPEFPKETLPSLREPPVTGTYRGACVGVSAGAYEAVRSSNQEENSDAH